MLTSTLRFTLTNMDRNQMEYTIMRKLSLFKHLFIVLLLSFSFVTHADTSYRNVYIFGDSLSDTGNLGAVIGGIPAPYYNNRISNGPVAVDLLTAKMGLNAKASLYLLGLNAGDNYSVAGAKASSAEPIDLDAQILAFQSNHGFTAPEDALYIIFIGGNDVRAALYEPDDVIAKTIIKTAIKKVKNAVNILNQMGARSFLVINVPDIGSIPETHLIATATANPALIKRATKFTKRYNKMLHKLIKKIKHNDDIEVTEFDLRKLFANVFVNAAASGFTNTTDACFSSMTFTFHPDCNYGLNADQFIFFDEIHPTKRVHAIFGEAFYKALNDEEDDK